MTAIVDLPKPIAPVNTMLLYLVDILSGKMSSNVFSQYGKIVNLPSWSYSAFPR